jgi:ribonuclease HII
MRYPNFNEEKILWQQGFKCVVGLDEAGRGPLAGPVVAAAVLIKPEFKILKGVKDSKKISEKKRDYFYKILTNNSQIKWGIGIVSEKVIDEINILEATKLAMLTAIEDLKSNVDHLILDGNFEISSEIPQKSVIKGDVKVFSCSAAGIIAKVTRDRIMLKYDKKYPEYGFKRHKGYGTAAHIKTLCKIGPCPIHRKSFVYECL